jgi:Zn-finger nucleic acid-binding protein
MSERQGIEIDYCQTCRGVWLDRGELDKIIERSAAPQQAQPAPQPQAPPPQPHSPWGGQPHGHGHYPYHKRRKSFLEELFD